MGDDSGKKMYERKGWWLCGEGSRGGGEAGMVKQEKIKQKLAWKKEVGKMNMKVVSKVE